jgi:predicted metal-dependent phosphoesterase TrpH
MNSMYKIDLHTHSVHSYDGGLSENDYKRMLASGRLDIVAVTDHNTIDFARKLYEELHDKIIVGEEITTRDGELVGLYLQQAVPAGLSAVETAAAIREQGGIVYVPHPFATIRRKGLQASTLDAIKDSVEIIEAHNGRAIFQNTSRQAAAWAALHHKGIAAASDAHGKYGWGRTYSIVNIHPTSQNLAELLMDAGHQEGFVGVRGIVYPKFNRLKKKVRHA